ncbi:MAG: site-2 protease family protein, partial [Gammaproteobacteria bacterium]|nr:site-2 protease family protein [Gammaproteobacteria bacterium]
MNQLILAAGELHNLDIVYSILAFIVAIGVLVTVHEFGHYWVARRLGVKVLRFSIGFGRAL